MLKAMGMLVQTVCGPVPVTSLGRTLMHEHIFAAFPGAEWDPGFPVDRADLVRTAVQRLCDLKACGVSTFVDPCPIELGRDVTLLREVSEKAEMHIVCATGFYHEDLGIPAYWRHRSREEVAELFVHELERGIGRTGIRPGLIKCATGAPAITPLERRVLEAACIAQVATGVPVITHTQAGVCGPEQQEIFIAGGVPTHRCLIGHCCHNPDHGYHLKIAARGSYVGFDRIGYARFQSDEVRADNIVKLVRAGHAGRVIMSQDRLCAYQGKPALPDPPPFTDLFTRFFPLLRARGLGESEINSILEDNPRRYFSGEEPAG
jgi:phosphotriesterase-related protein